jgi:ATP-dependent exoDNAse (exonuclease V) beta subunit
VVAVAECTQARQQVAPDLVASDLADATALSLKPDGMSLPKDVEVPIEASECHTFLDWRSFLEAHERSGEDAEKARLLYVALTRAREAVVLSVDCPLSAQGSLPDRALASSVVRSLLGGTLPEPGCSGLAFGGGTDGVVRRVDLTLADDPACVHASSDGSMPAFDGDLPADVSSLVVAGVAGDSATASQPFMLFSPERDDLPSVGTWSAHDGILSYSGSHTREGTAAADALSYASATVSPFDEADQPHPDTTPAEVERATNLGTAFHEAARLLIETGQVPSAGRLDVLCRADGVLRTQRPRLEEALARWQASPTRAELLACAHVGAEVPFCVPVTSERGSLLEGAIDALGTDDAHGAALVVDYKTGDAGLSPAELTQAHQMQARYYAHVLKGQGYARVSCAFVCVELVAVDGGPVVVRYEWPDGCDAEL